MNRLVLFSILYLTTAVLVYVLSGSGIINILAPGILHSEVNTLDIEGYGLLEHYSGIVDALSHIAYGVEICRVDNVYGTIEFVKELRDLGLIDNDTFYLLMDNNHVRGVVISDKICKVSVIYENNNTVGCAEYQKTNTTVQVIDYTDSEYTFNPKDSIIIKCDLIFDNDDIYPDCNIIYYKGEYDFAYKDEINEILEYATKGTS